MEYSSFNPDRVLIDELQQQLIKSAEIGKHLLEEQETLREQMETQRKEYTKQIEVSCVKESTHSLLSC